MKQYKDKPHVRKWVKKYLEQNPHLSLEDMARRYYFNKSGQRCNLYFTDGFRNQARLMLKEQKSNQSRMSPAEIAEESNTIRSNNSKPNSGILSVTFQQRRKLTTSGTLMVTRGGKTLLLDSFNIAKENLRKRFISRLYKDGSLKTDSFPRASLSQCLMEMAVEASSWPKPPAEEVSQPKKVLSQFDFERMLAEHYNRQSEVPLCHIERVVYPQKEGGA